jgi:hypothetical protein
VGALDRPDRVGAFGGGRFVVVDKQGLWPGLFHVPANVVGQHAQKHVDAHPVVQPMADGRTSSSQAAWAVAVGRQRAPSTALQ